MHALQQHILSQLIHHSDRRYADLKPADVEGNLFMYHMRHLINAGYVTKRDDGRYELSTEGKRYVDGLSLSTLVPRSQAKIVTLLVCRNSASQWLFLRRKRQPLLGMVGFPYGKVHFGETIAQAAQRELADKTGLTGNLAHRGDGYITIRQHDEVVSQIMFHLFYADHLVGELTPETDKGQVFWAPIEAMDDTYMPSVADILAILERGDDRFFVELSYQL